MYDILLWYKTFLVYVCTISACTSKMYACMNVCMYVCVCIKLHRMHFWMESINRKTDGSTRGNKLKFYTVDWTEIITFCHFAPLSLFFALHACIHTCMYYEQEQWSCGDVFLGASIRYIPTDIDISLTTRLTLYLSFLVCWNICIRYSVRKFHIKHWILLLRLNFCTLQILSFCL